MPPALIKWSWIFHTQQGFNMKGTTFFSLVIFFIATFVCAQQALAIPNSIQPLPMYEGNLTSKFSVDEGKEENDDKVGTDEHDQCILLFPFCEAN